MGEKGGRCCQCCTTVVTISILIVASVLFICLGAGSIPFLTNFYKDTVLKQLVMKYSDSSGGNEAYKNWNSPPAPVYMQFYMFNYTNVDEIINEKAKPNVTQLGPYSYREVRENVILHQNENEITYLQNYSYVFDPATSCANCSENDTIITPNLAVITFQAKLKDLNITPQSGFVKRWAIEALDKLLNDDKTYKMFIPLPVHKLLWGYTSPFLDHLEGLIPKVIRNLIPNLPPPFIALQQNGTAGAVAVGNITILTGKEDINKVQITTKWRGKNSTGSWNGDKFTNFWQTPYGNMINGTDGSHFQPYISKDDVIYIFNPQLCRSLYLNYQRDTSIMDIKLLRYTTRAKIFQNYTANPDNKAFCGPKRCYPSGLLPVGQCQPGNPPVFMSSPHFYQGYPALWQSFNGLHPETDLHETYLSIEPTTGIVMDAHKRLQINVNIQKVPYISRTDVFPEQDNFYPVLFVHEYATIDKASADRFKKEVMLPKQMITIMEYGLIGLGGLFLIIALVLGARHQRKKNQQSVYTEFSNEEDEKNIQQVTYPI